ncbi:hypothetical protein BWK69_00830 [Candidatus Parcubacteria bacterium A4]|nr:MAG: hypothetical protein BWK69_00830 [Candidatus Parcubacteria bacterium A4]
MNFIMSWFCKLCVKPIVDALLIKEVKGLENIPKKENFILMANHQSHMDEMVAGYVCVPRAFHFIGQVDSYSGLTKVLLYFLYFIAGVIHLNRKSEESKKKSLEESINYLKKGHCLIIYPEGTRTRTGEIGEGRWGTAKLYLRTGVPILPVGIKGTHELMPPKSGKIKIRRSVYLNIGQPLVFEKELAEAEKIECGTEEYKQICRRITEKVMAEIKNLVANN